jgi:hypothetical protein
MRMSAGRIRSINRTLARINGTSYTTLERTSRRVPDSPVPASTIPPHTIRVVAVARPAA